MGRSKIERRPGSPSVLDVASRSGVSPSTVCRVINNRKNVSEKARGKVLEACSKLGFKKNAAASSLRLRRSDQVACLMPDSTNEMFIDKIFNLKKAVLQLGRSWRLHSYRDMEEALLLLEEIVASRPAGAILGCVPGDDARRLLLSNDVATVCYDCADPELDSVALDRANGMYEAASHLIKSGRRQTVLLGFDERSERAKGCLRAFAEAGLGSSCVRFWGLPFDRDLFRYGYVEMGRAIAELKFDSVISVNDASAIGAMRRLQESGLKIPSDVSVVGFDDIMVSSFTTPALSTVSQPKERMAEMAVGFLAKRLNDPSLARQFALLKTNFVKRESA